MSGEWTVIESTDGKGAMEEEEAVTDICLLTKKEKVPSGYTVIDTTIDGKKADFAEGMFSSTRRYLAYTKKVPSTIRGRITVIDLKVVGVNDRAPLGYLPLTHTHDDNTKAFSSRVLIMKVGPNEQTTRAITEIQILSASRKEDVPTGFKRLPDINGFSICYKVGDVGKKKAPQPAIQLAPETSTENMINKQSTLARNVRAATDGLKFTLNPKLDQKQYLIEHALGDFQMLSLDDLEEKYTVDFSKYHSVANPT